MGRGNKCLFMGCGSPDQDGRHDQIYSKSPLKIFFSRTKRPVTLGLGMQHLGLGPNKVFSNDDLGLTLSFFYSKVKLASLFFYNIRFFTKKVRKSFNERNLPQMTEVTRCFC